MLKWTLLAIAVGLILVAVGATIIGTADLFPLKTVKEIHVNEASTDWYSTEIFYANAGDKLIINVTASGISAKLRVDTQEGQTIFGEVQGTLLWYEVPITSDNAYSVVIWTRAWPFPSDYVDLNGTINLKRVFTNLYPTGYVGLGAILLGLLITSSSIVIYRYKKSKAEEEKQRMEKLRVCPYCGQKVSIEKSICPLCGFDITRSVRCKYCDTFYDRSLQKCPSCGAKQAKQ